MANVMNPTVAPAPLFPEVAGNIFERTMGPDIPGQRGSLRFEEGVATDTDVPNDFAIGSYVDPSSVPGRPNHNNPAMFYKPAEVTMQERAHVGSASWIEAPSVLGEFVQGVVAGDGMPKFERSFNSGAHMNRPNATRVHD
ncbi:uncharacterized protein METZ01_LOCUS296167 [marine metagenome]|uniref:Uncharacterized protein n=1 Tax=marine metagenome TaxID=408172 RepID=A0A382M355_9ZZZZ